MTPGRSPGSPVHQPLVRLFDGSSLVGLTDGELLARFVQGRDESAFEGLVARWGPMVLGVCRRMLPDRGDADDAFQATFLVLVRRAASVGRGDLIGPWLHGVAVRVCRKSRVQGARRNARERTGGVLDLVLPESSTPAASTLLDRSETRATIDDEIARLPEQARRLVILCDVEGLTRDEAADRLGWTANMVRGRLARARIRLRARLIHRGCVPAGLEPLIAETSGLAPLPWVLAPSPVLVATTARAALLFLSPPARGAVAALATSSAFPLAQGVLRVMTFSSWKFVGSFAVAAALATAGTATVLVARQVPAQAPAPAPVVPAVSQRVDEPPRPPLDPPAPADASMKTLLEARLRKAQLRQEAQQAFYEEGRISIERLIDADRQLMLAEHALADNPETRRAAVQAYVDRLQKNYDREVREMENGRATKGDVAEVDATLLEARIMLAQQATPTAANPSGLPAKNPLYYTDDQLVPYGQYKRVRPGGEFPLESPPSPPGPKSSPAPPNESTTEAIAQMQQARIELARKLLDEAQRLYPTELSVQEYLKVIGTYNEAVLAAATTPEGRTAVLQAQIAGEQKALKATEDEAKRGERRPTDVIKAQIAVLDAQIRAARGGRAVDPQAIAELDRRLTELEHKVDRVLDLLNNNLPNNKRR